MPQKPLYHAVILDFDGTVCATGEGIIYSVKQVLSTMGYPIPSSTVLQKFIGPPPVYSYMTFCGMPKAEAEKALLLFRKIYNEEGWHRTKAYPNMDDLLKDLDRCGVKICTASSKPVRQIERLLQKFHLRQYFCGIEGVDETNETKRGADKPSLIRDAMACCEVTDPQKAVMIGDTHFDVEGAKEVGIPFIGAAYGYGGAKELLEAGASVLADSVKALYPLLFSDNI
ncbi:HAD hydrolase-like protein [Caproicibacterium sp. NSD3]